MGFKQINFKRTTVLLGHASREVLKGNESDECISYIDHPCVLIVNSSQDIAKEITNQLKLTIPNCTIQYAPTIKLAKCILEKRKIDLVVANAVMPDGHISLLHPSIKKPDINTDLIVVGNFDNNFIDQVSKFGLKFLVSKKLASANKNLTTIPIIHSRKDACYLANPIKTLGADLRNDLNNPLQEIVAMVFVAKTQSKASSTRQALEAIEKAAQNMATVVKKLEDRILEAVM